ncbi:MAG: trypsin-like peptidase domain-containing protein [Eubacteriaceae bacterium]|nr:trypsin-like peptidase domain-containing protein [Eubacteriaceae bacterium]
MEMEDNSTGSVQSESNYENIIDDAGAAVSAGAEEAAEETDRYSSAADVYKPAVRHHKAKRYLSFILAIVIAMVSGTAGGLITYYLMSRNAPAAEPVMYQTVIRYASEGEQPDAELTCAQVSEMTQNSVVQISTEMIQTSIYMQQYITSGAGSGVILSEDGYIVTNNHVIANATSVSVTLFDGTVYEASVVAADEMTDLAIIKIEASGLKPVILGDSDSVRVGDSVMIVGNPLGELGGSVSHGIISATDRSISVEGKPMVLLQTDAAINPGNSGGAMFNMYGELIGIVNAKSTGSSIDNLGFAIPVSTAKPVIEELLAYGYVRGRAYMGISMVSVNDVFTSMQYRVNEYGVYVTGVVSGSAADKAGVKTGDRIVSIGGYAINTDADVTMALLKFSAGDKTDIVIKRDGKEKSLDIVFDEYVPKKSGSDN